MLKNVAKSLLSEVTMRFMGSLRWINVIDRTHTARETLTDVHFDYSTNLEQYHSRKKFGSFLYNLSKF